MLDMNLFSVLRDADTGNCDGPDDAIRHIFTEGSADVFDLLALISDDDTNAGELSLIYDSLSEPEFLKGHSGDVGGIFGGLTRAANCPSWLIEDAYRRGLVGRAEILRASNIEGDLLCEIIDPKAR